MSFDLDTSEKIASLVAAILAIGSALLIKKNRKSDKENSSNKNESRNVNRQSVVVNVGEPLQKPAAGFPHLEENSLKALKRILFIDDDRNFKIVAILKKMGWVNTKIISDVNSVDSAALNDADVVFVDIQGVGKIMQYQDEGLGLALAIKRRHPNKKVVIYSAQEHGPRFHEAHQVADYSLPKTAEPIRFEEVILKVLRS